MRPDPQDFFDSYEPPEDQEPFESDHNEDDAFTEWVRRQEELQLLNFELNH